MKYLILLNRKFPYKSGEAFLENEIEEISKAFDKILIFPSDVKIGDSLTRKIVSQNVETIIFQNKNLRLSQIEYSLHSPLYIKESRSLKMIHRMLDGYFSAAVFKQSKMIIDYLEKIPFEKKDEIYVYSYWLYINAGVACILKDYFKKKNIKVKAFSRAHRFDIYEENRKFGYLPQREALMEKLDAIYPCSDNGTSYLKDKYPKYKNKFLTSYLGTYDHGLCRMSSDGTFRIVSCSRLSSVKRVDMIVNALALLKEKKIKIEWTHIGGGELLEHIKKKSKKLDWMIVNFTGAISNKDVYSYYSDNCVDAFINVSSSEGLPVSIMEATSYGIPIIATDVGGTKEIVVDNVSGYLLDKNFAPKDLAEKIIRLIEQDQERNIHLRVSTREYWKEHFQAPVNYACFLEKIIDY